MRTWLSIDIPAMLPVREPAVLGVALLPIGRSVLLSTGKPALLSAALLPVGPALLPVGRLALLPATLLSAGRPWLPCSLSCRRCLLLLCGLRQQLRF